MTTSTADKQAIAKLRQDEESAWRQWQEARRIFEDAQRAVEEAHHIYNHRRTVRRSAQWLAES